MMIGKLSIPYSKTFDLSLKGGADVEGFRGLKAPLRVDTMQLKTKDIDVSPGHTDGVCIATLWCLSRKLFIRSNFLISCAFRVFFG